MNKENTTYRIKTYKIQNFIKYFVQYFVCCIGLYVVNSVFSISSTYALEANVPLLCAEINKDENNEVLVKLKKLEKEKNFDEAYFTVKDEYHDRINDIFVENITKLSNNIYQNAGKNEKICSPFKYEKVTKSLKISREMIANFRKYECALEFYIKHPPYSGKEVFLNDGVVRLKTIQSRLRQEIRFSYLAMEKSLEMYNELRLWFPIHRDLLCLIEQMKTYRNAVRNFVDQIVRMPAKYYNYGSRYQQ